MYELILFPDLRQILIVEVLNIEEQVDIIEVIHKKKQCAVSESIAQILYLCNWFWDHGINKLRFCRDDSTDTFNIK